MKYRFKYSHRKILSLIVAVAILFSGIPITAAGAVTANTGGCTHEHNAAFQKFRIYRKFKVPQRVKEA